MGSFCSKDDDKKNLVNPPLSTDNIIHDNNHSSENYTEDAKKNELGDAKKNELGGAKKNELGGAELVIHVDIESIICLINKKFTIEQFIYLQTWKYDLNFINWTYRTYKNLYKSEYKNEKEEESFTKWKKWIMNKNQAHLIIQYSMVYCQFGRERINLMKELKKNICLEDNTYKSFWNFMDWILKQDKKILICLRSFENNIPQIFKLFENRGFEKYIIKQHYIVPTIWSIIYKCNSDMDCNATKLHPLDIISDEKKTYYIQPGNSLPKDSQNVLYAQRTEKWEVLARNMWVNEEYLEPYFTTQFVDITDDNCQPLKSINSANIHNIKDFNNKLYNLTFAGKLGIIAIHDNYKPWSQINSYNGKIVINDCRKQIVFSQNCFSRGSPYSYSIYKCIDNKCQLIKKDKKQLQQTQFDGHNQIVSQNINYPLFYSLYTSESKNNALNNLNYFIEYLQTDTI